MLVLSRRVGEKIGHDIVVSVVAIDGNRVKIALEAPDQVRILRSELVEGRLAEESRMSKEELAACC